MAVGGVRAQMQVGIDDTAFKEFKKSFDHYKQQLDSTEESWNKIGSAQKSAAITFTAVAAAMMAQNDMLADALKKMHEQKHAADNTAHSVHGIGAAWEHVVGSVERAGDKIRDVLTSVARFVSVGSVVGLVSTVGGAFGMGELAESLSGMRRESLRTGVPIGFEESMDAVYARLFDPVALMEGINAARGDISQYPNLLRTGIPMSTLQGPNQGIATALIGKLEQVANMTRGNNQIFGQTYLDMYGLSRFFTLQDLTGMRNTPVQERRELADQLNAQAKNMEMADKTGKIWADLNQTLEYSKLNLELTLGTALKGLAPAMGDLVTALTSVINALVGSGAFKDIIDTVTHGIQGFATWVKSDQAKQDIKAFTDDVKTSFDNAKKAMVQFEDVMGGIYKFAIKAGLITDPKQSKDDQERIEAGQKAGTWQTMLSSVGLGDAGFHQPIDKFAARTRLEALGLSHADASAMIGNALWESGGDPNKWGDNGKAYGLFQWHADRQRDFAKRYGHSMLGSPWWEQLDFAKYELTEGKYSLVGQRMREAKTDEEKVRIFNEGFERPLNPRASEKQRERLAREVGYAADKVPAAPQIKWPNAPTLNVSVHVTQPPGTNTSVAARQIQ